MSDPLLLSYKGILSLNFQSNNKIYGVYKMRNYMHLLFIGVSIASLLTGCAVNVSPVLNSSLSMDAFEKMGKIDVQDIKLALYIDPKIKELRIEQNVQSGKFSFNVGRAFSAKLIKALAYNFKTIHFIESPNYTGTDTIDAVMYVNLEDVDLNLSLKSGLTTVSAETYTRLSIRAEIKDFEEKKTIWVGTTQAKESATHQELGPMYYQEAGRGYAMAIDSAIDKAIGDLISDMSKSQNLSVYIDKWEQKRKGVSHASQ